jgi:hypothetical protein
MLNPLNRGHLVHKFNKINAYDFHNRFRSRNIREVK